MFFVNNNNTIQFLIFYISFACLACFGCNGKNLFKNETPCERFDRILNGPFVSEFREGTMTFTGGLTGTMEAVGVDYNDMVCNYTITDCNTGLATLNCQGAPHEVNYVILSDDSIKIDNDLYVRLQSD